MLLTRKEENSAKLLDICKLDTFIVFPFYMFHRALQINMSWSDILELVERFKSARNEILGYNLGNGMSKLQYRDKIFTFSIYINPKTNDNEVCFWNDLGTTSIYSIFMKDTKITEQQIELIEQHLIDYCDGIVKCSECGKKLIKEEIAGRYYAGVYCKHCWETKWEAIEARDNYD